MINSLLREPLIHFLLAAVALFVFFDIVDYPADTNVIRISHSKIQAMQNQWQKQWRRPPSDEELDGIIKSAVHGELYYREGLRLGLDLDDAVVRNRMIQKMRFLQDQQVLEPDKQQLQNWMSEHKTQYPDQILYSFAQVYLGTEVNKAEAHKLASRLNDGELSVEDIAMSLLAPAKMERVKAKEISRNFGRDFSSALASLNLHLWIGPVQSGFGSHLVKVEHIETIPMSLDIPEMQQTVRNDWLNAQKEQAEQKTIQALLERYKVEFEGQ